MKISGHLLSDPCGVAEIQAEMGMRQYTQSADQSLASSNCQSVTWTQLHLYWTADIQIGDYLRYLLQQFSETVPIPRHYFGPHCAFQPNAGIQILNWKWNVCRIRYVFQVKCKSESKYLIDNRWSKIISSLNITISICEKHNIILLLHARKLT